MPLSEEELRALEQMERALSLEDPKFVSTLRGTRLRQAQQLRAVASGLCFLAGVALLMVGVITTYWVIGVVGFLVMLASASAAISATSGAHVSPPLDGEDGHGSVSSRSDRWRRRHHDDQEW
ncbi:MAG: DUF3040 domain-containing protein [Nocardioides sp.]|uniref:DUF3040 domain-containing protein n=1 Tax=Nocardioides sp. TaxID=35761 RepID=UPI0039E5E830